MSRILLLGGTTEAGALAQALAGAGIAAVYSYAGAVAAPRSQPLPVRVGASAASRGFVPIAARKGSARSSMRPILSPRR
ncbi:precorrin-6A/cobalt-precorrin-6A reductase [Paracoccus cavernae]|uniref:Precorrin-6A/cobalt-precorrin-6A reductase n=1 Tax=Paracoccus cavernae TaxID=1571207 RepID=A0ABT8D5B3_9RHOB|nr:precorrin-6A/cobalt-precorrin-6A reductase [Paracoccus cavernae]